MSLAVAAGALVLSYLCVAGFRRWAGERVLDIPDARSSHTRPTPRGGGLGIVICVLIGAWSLFIYRILSMPFKEIAALTLGGSIVALVGWLDDIHRLPYRIRLVVQAISSTIILIMIGYFRTVTVPFVGDIHLYSIGIPFALLWIMGLTNAYNFMDGIDGIAGGQALIAGSGWAIIGYLSGETFVGLIGVLLAATSLGFLFHNWPPARIFMGDVGSAFIGFILAVLPIIAGHKNPRFMIAGLLMVWPFIFDTSFTLVRRMIKKENIFEAHRSHIYQRLVIARYSHRFVTLVYMGLALTGAILAFLWVKDSYGSDILVILIPTLLFFGLWQITIRAEKT
ncbi:MAG TPA: glycosyltransferase family 4 protein [Candidatus Desulfaltia sp.]|nr:glycosyltransferase family 4 protein [Candidatus Desulfaltia sp.]